MLRLLRFTSLLTAIFAGLALANPVTASAQTGALAGTLPVAASLRSVQSSWFDAVLGRSYGAVSAAKPGQPAHLVAGEAKAGELAMKAPSKPAAILVHRGDHLVLHRDEEALQLTMEAIAEQDGALDQIIQLAGVSPMGAAPGDAPRKFRGRVRAQAAVEWLP